MDLLIKDGHVIDPGQNLDGIMDILVEKGLIKKIGPNIPENGARVISAKGLIVAPGFIDMHVHLREPGFENKETIATGTRAAAAGGFTSVACMPNTNPVVDNQSVVEFILSKAELEGVVNVFPIGAITKNLEGVELSNIGELRQAGAVGISDDGKPVQSAEIMRRAMQYARMFDLPVIDHCEDKTLTVDGVMHEGVVATKLGLPGMPSVAEEVMVRRDIALARGTGCHFHAAHVSTWEAVAAIRNAKKAGIRVTAEATPHHFILDHEALLTYSTMTKMNPPLRGKEDVEAVREGLADGTIDAIATDHAPHGPLDKDVEFQQAAFGIVGLETALGLTLTFLVKPGILTLSQAISRFTGGPSRILGLNRGALKEGMPADITLFDPDVEWVVDREKFKSRSKNTPFHNWKLNGRAVTTIVNGKIAYELK